MKVRLKQIGYGAAGLVWLSIALSFLMYFGRFIPDGKAKIEELSLGRILIDLLIIIPSTALFIIIVLIPIKFFIDKLFD